MRDLEESTVANVSGFKKTSGLQGLRVKGLALGI